jgi:hypothetical protein
VEVTRTNTLLELASAERDVANFDQENDLKAAGKVPNLSRNLALPDMLWSRQLGETGGQFPGTLVQTRQLLE